MNKEKKNIGQRLLDFFTIVLCIGTIGYIAVKYLNANSQEEEIKLARTPINILDVKPIGTLYLYTTEVEDFKIDVIEAPGVFSEDYLKCVQILREQLNWVIDLNKVKYEVDSTSNNVFITLPPIEFKMSHHGEWFYNEGSEQSNYDSRMLKKQIVKKIEKKYMNKESMEKAQSRAIEVIGAFVRLFDKEPIFNINKNSD